MATQTGGLFGFDSALLILKAGGRVTRVGWGGGGNWLDIHESHPNSRQVIYTLHRTTSDGFTVPYTPTTADILYEDWTAEHMADMMMQEDD